MLLFVTETNVSSQNVASLSLFLIGVHARVFLVTWVTPPACVLVSYEAIPHLQRLQIAAAGGVLAPHR